MTFRTPVGRSTTELIIIIIFIILLLSPFPGFGRIGYFIQEAREVSGVLTECFYVLIIIAM